MTALTLRRHRVLRRLSGAVLCASFAVMYLAGTVAADSVTFGTGTGSSNFGTSMSFTESYSGTVRSASLLLRLPYDNAGPRVIAVKSLSSGSLTATVDTTGGWPFPFAPVVANFEVTLADGTVQDGPDIDLTYADDRFTWKTLTGTVIRLHYLDASASFAQRMLSLADGGVQRAAAMFGVTETQPIDYYVYPSQSAFQQGLNQPDTVGGVAEPQYRVDFSIVANGDTSYAAQVMPHEPTHVVFWDATNNPYHSTPRWVDEGFAQYVSQGYDSDSKQQVAQAVSSGEISSLLALTDFFPMDSTRIYLAYAEAVSAVDFMVRKYGQADILKLVKAYAAGDSDDAAFTAAFGLDMAGFDAAWEADLGVKPTKYGPQPAATGPLPPGWSTSGDAGASAEPNSNNGGTSSGSSTPGQQSGSQSAQAVFLLAGALAAVGVVLVGASLFLFVSARDQSNQGR